MRMASRMLAMKMTSSSFFDPSFMEAGKQIVTTQRRRLAAGCPSIILDNVADLYWSSPKMEWGNEDFPNIAPPFEEVFFEWNTPSVLNCKEGVIVRDGLNQVGCFMSSFESGWILELRNKDRQAFDRSAYRIFTISDHAEWDHWVSNSHWICCSTIYLANKASGGIPCFMGLFHVNFVAKDGTIKQSQYTGFASNKDLEEVCPIASMAGDIRNLGVSFMHCKNVSSVESQENNPEPKTAHRLKIPKVRYHVLQIDPMREVLRREGQMETTGLKQALHICRGHFRTYDESRPGLFGRGQHGQFWIPQHARGKAEHGVVIKDYSVKGKK